MTPSEKLDLSEIDAQEIRDGMNMPIGTTGAARIKTLLADQSKNSTELNFRLMPVPGAKLPRDFDPAHPDAGKIRISKTTGALQVNAGGNRWMLLEEAHSQFKSSGMEHIADILQLTPESLDAYRKITREKALRAATAEDESCNFTFDQSGRITLEKRKMPLAPEEAKLKLRKWLEDALENGDTVLLSDKEGICISVAEIKKSAADFKQLCIRAGFSQHAVIFKYSGKEEVHPGAAGGKIMGDLLALALVVAGRQNYLKELFYHDKKQFGAWGLVFDQTRNKVIILNKEAFELGNL